MMLEILLSCLMSSASTTSAADLLKNPSFESPPSNLPPNTTTTTTLSTNTTIPGWSFTGTVHYVTAGPNLSLPNGGGHAIQLGRGGKINQTLKSSGAYEYVLTFSLASIADDNENCSAVAGVNVSGLGYSSVFTIEGRYGRERWESHAFYMLGLIERGLPVDVEIESVAMEGDPDVLCGPVVDTFVLKVVDVPKGYNDNLLTNGGFETGPAFIPNSSEGVLLDQDKYDRYSVLQQWSVIGTVKYIDSKHYMVPKGNAAVELISGPYSGVAIELSLKTSPTYKLSFTMGDTNDTCVGEFVVGVQAGLTVQNFTLQSNGTGHAQNFSMSFNPDPMVTRIEFMSLRQSLTRDLSFCGPVIDNVVLIASDGSISGGARYGFMSMVCLIVVVLNILG